MKIVAWVGSEVLPHEGDVRAWLRRMTDPDELEDVLQEAYCRISRLDCVDHIRSGRAYLFTATRHIVLERLRRARIVSIEAVTEIDALSIFTDDPCPERIAGARRELARVKALIDALPERCRRIFELRKVDGLPQREVARMMGVSEHIVENEVAKGLKLILKALSQNEHAAEAALTNVGQDERARDSRSD